MRQFRRHSLLWLALAVVVGLAGCSSPERVRRVSTAQEPPTVLPPPKPSFAGRLSRPGSSGAYYVVAGGDTLYSIAQKLNVPLRALIDSNRLAPPYILNIGQTLSIPQQQVHVVARGDTVYGISRRYGVDMAELVRLNGIGAPYTIAVGQRLVLPQATPARSEPAPAVERPVVAAAPAPSPASRGEDSRPAIAAAPPPPQSASGQQAVASLPAQPRPRGGIPEPPPRAGSKFLQPVSGKIIARYGPQGDGRHNDGINIAAERGQPVAAADNGVVVYAGNELRGFGNLLLVKHDGGWITAYAHNETLLVDRGAEVRRGQTIARVGSSGAVGSPQLHFEIRKGTRAIDPNGLLE